jgi:hypothetical protein
MKAPRAICARHNCGYATRNTAKAPFACTHVLASTERFFTQQTLAYLYDGVDHLRCLLAKLGTILIRYKITQRTFDSAF